MSDGIPTAPGAEGSYEYGYGNASSPEEFEESVRQLMDGLHKDDEELEKVREAKSNPVKQHIQNQRAQLNRLWAESNAAIIELNTMIYELELFCESQGGHDYVEHVSSNGDEFIRCVRCWKTQKTGYE